MRGIVEDGLIERNGNRLSINGFDPCVVLLNNDLSAGLPEILKDLEQIVLPPVHAWEAAALPAEQAGVRVVYLRTGLVLDKSGGLLKAMSLAFRLFAGGPLAGGQSWTPWISMPDWVSAVVFLIEHDQTQVWHGSENRAASADHD